MKFALTAAFALIALLGPSRAAEPANPVLFDMDTLRHRPTEFTTDKNEKKPAGSAELVDGRLGKAVRFSFAEGARGGFMTASMPPDPQRDNSAGFSFWVKGDGSSHWGGIELIDRDNYGLRYGYCFPIDSTEWRQIVVPWQDLVPELSSPLVDPKSGYAPSKFGNFWFGKWYYWRDYPAHAYTIDHIALEPKIDIATTPLPETALGRIRAKLKAHRPITLVTMGDSLTDTRHWANRETVWPKLLAAQLKTRFNVDARWVNPAIGGTTLSQNTILMPRWSKEAPSPDLVTIWFGFNDWDSGVRGERFAEYLRLAIDRIRRQTNGSADILLLTTNPAHGRWETMREMEDAARKVAAEKRTGLADIAAEFRKQPTPDEALKQTYWAWDKTHLGPKGHAVVAETVLRALEPQ